MIRLACLLLAAASVVGVHVVAESPQVIELRDIQHVEGHRCLAGLPDGLPAGDHHDESGTWIQCPPDTLREDGEPIGTPHTLHQTLVERGGGLYSHWKDGVDFSASDDTDPRINGRACAAVFPAASVTS